jgi:gas vesicle protein
MPTQRVFESFTLPIAIPGIAPVAVQATLPFRIETGSFRAEKSGPVWQSFSKPFPQSPAVVVIGRVRAGTLPTPPKPTPTTKVVPPSVPSISPVSVPTITAPPVPTVRTPTVKVEPFEALFPTMEVTLGCFLCERVPHKVGEMHVDNKPLPFRGIKELAVVWKDIEGKEVRRDKVPFSAPLCPVHLLPATSSVDEDTFKKAVWDYWWHVGSDNAPWGFGWLAGRITAPMGSGFDGSIKNAIDFGNYIGKLSSDQTFKTLSEETKKVKAMTSDLTAKVNDTLDKLTSNIKDTIDRHTSSLVGQINAGYAKFKGEVETKYGRFLEGQRVEIQRWCDELNKALATETENAKKALQEATENIRRMEGLREGVLATPVALRRVLPTGFEIEGVEGATYDWVAIG